MAAHRTRASTRGDAAKGSTARQTSGVTGGRAARYGHAVTINRCFSTNAAAFILAIGASAAGDESSTSANELDLSVLATTAARIVDAEVASATCIRSPRHGDAILLLELLVRESWLGDARATTAIAMVRTSERAVDRMRELLEASRATFEPIRTRPEPIVGRRGSFFLVPARSAAADETLGLEDIATWTRIDRVLRGRPLYEISARGRGVAWECVPRGDVVLVPHELAREESPIESSPNALGIEIDRHAFEDALRAAGGRAGWIKARRGLFDVIEIDADGDVRRSVRSTGNGRSAAEFRMSTHDFVRLHRVIDSLELDRLPRSVGDSIGVCDSPFSFRWASPRGVVELKIWRGRPNGPGVHEAVESWRRAMAALDALPWND